MSKSIGHPDDAQIRRETTPDGETTLWIDGNQAMQAWELDLMHECADILVEHGSVFLEVGLGLGLSAMRIAAAPATKRHVLVEKYEAVVKLFYESEESVPPTLEIVTADFFQWLDTAPAETFDGIFFDPALPPATWNNVELWASVVPKMARLLRPGGVFIPFFNTEPRLREQYLSTFPVATMLRRPYRSYDGSYYAHTPLEKEGHAYIQCFYRDIADLRTHMTR